MTSTALATNGVAAFPRLDPYSGGIAAEEPRVDSLATISCGYRAEADRNSNRPGLPRASRPNDPRQIHLHDPYNRAPGLAAALEAGGYRELVITFPLDDPRQFVIQRFTRYSATRLEAYGDETALYWIKAGDPPEHQRFEAGTPEYERLVRTCKADTRIYFCLAEWGEDGPEVVFPDGLGSYAIRTTSRHSVRSILGSLAYTAKFTRGHIAGLPFLLSVDHREVAGPDGAKRVIPVWTITTKPPEGARLSSRTFRDIATSALRQGASLMLPAPSDTTWETLDAEGPPDIDEPTEQDVARIEAGGLCDYEFYIRAWHALARGSAFESDAARAAFLGSYTEERTTSLAEFLQGASEQDAAALISALGAAVTNERQHRNARDYDRIFGPENEPLTVDRHSGEVFEDRAADAPAPTSAALEGRGESARSPRRPTPEPAHATLTVTDDEAAALAENAARVEDARQLGVIGVDKFVAKPGWPLERVRSANVELAERVKSHAAF